MTMSLQVGAAQCVGVAEWVSNRVQHRDATPPVDFEGDNRPDAALSVVMPEVAEAADSD